MDNGYIKLWRKIQDSAIFQDPELFKLATICLLKASHKKRTVIHDKQEVELNPGEFITGRFSLHSDYYQKKSSKNVSPITLWRWLEKLKNLDFLNIKTNNKFSVISIVNWEAYQCSNEKNEQQNDQQMINRRTTDEQQMITNKNVKECKECKEKTPPGDIPEHSPKETGESLTYHERFLLQNKLDMKPIEDEIMKMRNQIKGLSQDKFKKRFYVDSFISESYEKEFHVKAIYQGLKALLDSWDEVHFNPTGYAFQVMRHHNHEAWEDQNRREHEYIKRLEMEPAKNAEVINLMNRLNKKVA